MVETLIKAGAFDSTGAMRRALVEALDAAIEQGQAARRDRLAGQLSMFGGMAEDAPSPKIGTEEWSDSEMLAHEKAALGFYITKHPLAQYEDLVRKFSTHEITMLKNLGDGQTVTVGGLITRLRTVPIRSGRNAGKKMLIATFEDFSGSVEVVVFSEQLPEFQPLLKPDALVFITGTVDRRREEPSLRVSVIVPLEQAPRRLSRQVVLRMQSTGGPLDSLGQVATLCREHRGQCEVYFEVGSPEGWFATVRPRQQIAVDPTSDLLAELRSVPGVDDVLCGGARGTINVG